MLIQAWDVSPNHCGAVEVDSSTGKMTWHSFAATGPTAVKRHAGAVLLPEMKGATKHAKSCDRITRLFACFSAWAARPGLGLIAIEDYAMGASQGAHYIGEIGGVARLAIRLQNVPIRLWGLKSIKKFWTDNGNATKDEMAERTARAGIAFGYSAQADEDLCDAYALSQLVLAELSLSRGTDPKSLPKHQRDVLCRKVDEGCMAWQRPLIGA